MKYLCILILLSIACIGFSEADQHHPSVFRQLQDEPHPIWVNIESAGKQVKSFFSRLSDPLKQFAKFITDIFEKVHQFYRDYQRQSFVSQEKLFKFNH